MKTVGSIVRQPDGPFRGLRSDEQGNLCVRSPTDGLPTQKYLTLAGDGLISGTYNAIGNYATPTDFYYLTSTIYDIHSILIAITDLTTFNYNDYGGIPIGTVLNGVKMFVYNAALNLEIPLLSGKAIKYNYEWFELTANTGLTSFSGTPQTLRVVFEMDGDYGMNFRLNPGDKFIVRLQDNFTGLIGHTFGLRGIKQS